MPNYLTRAAKQVPLRPSVSASAGRHSRIPELRSQVMAAQSVDPPAATSLPQPPISHMGDSVSFRDAVSRWYPHGGGLDEQVAHSQRAMKKYPVPEWEFYGSWKPKHVDAAHIVRDTDALPSHVQGQWLAGDNTVELNKAHWNAGMRQAILEHELTHALTLPSDESGFGALVRHTSANEPMWALPDIGIPEDAAVLQSVLSQARTAIQTRMRAKGVPESHVSAIGDVSRNPAYHKYYAYASKRGEVDPRLAEVRRRYSYVTGNSVLTPDDSRKAWQWWLDNQRQWHHSVHAGNRATISDAHLPHVWNAMPDSVKDVMFRRMTHVPVIAAPIIGAAAAQEDRPYLDNLRR